MQCFSVYLIPDVEEVSRVLFPRVLSPGLLRSNCPGIRTLPWGTVDAEIKVPLPPFQENPELSKFLSPV